MRHWERGPAAVFGVGRGWLPILKVCTLLKLLLKDDPETQLPSEICELKNWMEKDLVDMHVENCEKGIWVAFPAVGFYGGSNEGLG